MQKLKIKWIFFTWWIRCRDSRATPNCRVLPPPNSAPCHPRATYHIAGCCHLVNSLSWFQSHATLQGTVTWWNQCHDRATLQGVIIPYAILKVVFRHILFFFKCSLGFDKRRLSYRLRYTCYSSNYYIVVASVLGTCNVCISMYVFAFHLYLLASVI